VEPEALRAQLGTGAADLTQILPELREILPGLSGPAAVEVESARFRLFDAATQFLRNASERRPYCSFWTTSTQQTSHRFYSSSSSPVSSGRRESSSSAHFATSIRSRVNLWP
jgi:hypothetical protein